MDQNELFVQLKKEPVGKLYLFCGKEDFLKEKAVAVIKRALLGDQIDEFNYCVLDEEADALRIVNACCTPPFFGDQKMVLVRNSFLLREKGKKNKKENALEAFLQKELPDCTLVFLMQDDVDTAANSLYNTIKKRGVLVEFRALTPVEREKWITKELRNRAISMDEDAKRFFLDYAPQDLMSLNNEINKLGDIAAETGRIDTAQAEGLLSRSVEYNIYKIFDHVMSGNGAAATTVAKGLIRDGEDEIAVLGAIARSFHQLLLCKMMKNDGCSSAQIASRLGVRDFVVRMMERNASSRSLERIESYIDVLKKTDEALKRELIDKTALVLRVVLELSLM